MTDIFICGECGGKCRLTRLTWKRMCVDCKTMFEEYEVLIDYDYRTAFETRLNVYQKDTALRDLRELGLKEGQVKQIMKQSEPVKEYELYLMIKTGWSLPKVQEVIRSAKMYGLLTDVKESDLLSEERININSQVS